MTDADPWTAQSLTDAVADRAARHLGVDRAHVHLTPVDYAWGSPATAGLWKVEAAAEGLGAQQSQPVTRFAKLLRHPRHWPGLRTIPEGGARDFFLERFPWRFELDMALSGIDAVMPPGLRTPVLHDQDPLDEDHVLLWWELVDERPGPWSTAELADTAGLLGRLAARRREGAAVNAALPEVCHQLPRGAALRLFSEPRVLLFARAELAPDGPWSHPLVVETLRDLGDDGLRAELLGLVDLVPAVLDALDDLPQTYAHGDASVQNLLRSRAGGDVVVIDWGFGSLLAVGFDLGQLLVGPMHAGLTSADDVPAIDAAILPAYVAGLGEEGWTVPTHLVRFGHLGSLFARSLFTALPVDALPDPAGGTGRDDGHAAARALLRERLTLTRAMLDLTLPVVREHLAGVTSRS
ncbi:hypothetical protein DFJ68_1756 [Terracoccus luteus]|uniref:Phosphotransferase family enzyme n=1 Tax=Terracoccus luteus TaxID=53356 RepID=A0A495Y0M6_9MICO|nr:aminoglycoside phosphotransferase [Terracoccus luteus]RKT78313.1 hypothetical protein DFJ68_1756 [Terracoccus luteus]